MIGETNTKVKPVHGQEPYTERNEKVRKMYMDYPGRYSYNTLSRIFKITPQRIGQIIKKGQEVKRG